jgi:quercetin dioxygenase-like cupin family protein
VSQFDPSFLASEESSDIVRHASPGQEIAAHVHPLGQDTWTVVSGEADYYQGGGAISRIRAGDIAIARPGQIHDAINSGFEPFVFVSVVASGNAGFALAEE